jgi:hypothetical protein
MSGAVPLPRTSPDGRHALRVDETNDRGSIEEDTYLVDVVAQRDIAWLGNTVEGGFEPDGLLRVVRPPWNAWDVIVDPARECFRARDDLPWIPLAAWTVADSAYRQGWSQGIEFRASDPDLAFPWVELWVALGAVAFVALLAWKPWLDVMPRAILIVMGALVAVLFVWLTGTGLRSWRLASRLRAKRGAGPTR